MTGIPVVIAENGLGIPVRPVDANAPVMTVAENGLGAPIVISERGAPFIVEGIVPPPFTPADLFSEGQPGHWPAGYDPASGRLWQTTFNTGSGGAAVASSAGQTISLVLDWSREGATGVQALSNFDFSAGLTGWSNPSGMWSAVDGEAYLDSAGGVNRTLSQSMSGVVSGVLHRIDTDITFLSEGRISYAVDGVGTIIQPAATGVYVGFFSAAPSADASMRNTFSTNTVASVAYFSVLPILGYHAIQSTAGSRPTLAQTGGVWNLTNDDSHILPITLPAGTYGRAVVTAAGVVTIDTVVDPTDALVASGQADVILRQGAFTTQEIADITAYWGDLYP